jgi:glycine/D-amino acid oxidase-like deaminating enzyme
MLRARHATERVAAAAVAAGVTLRGRCRVEAVEDGTVTLADGTRLVADQVLLATGSWTSGLWEAAPIVATRQLTLYLDADPGPLPIFGEGAPFSHYGFPAHDGLGFKVGSHVTGAPGDPADEAARTALAAEVEGIRAYAARRFPATAGAPVQSADVCFYAMTPTADPVVDRLDDRTVVCAGFSGHGFKFAPVVAPAAAELVLGREPSVDVRPFAVPTTSRLSA